MAKVDAVIVPAGYADHPSPYWHLAAITNDFKDVLSGDPNGRVQVKSMSDSRELVTRDPAAVLKFGPGHPMEGMWKYNWEERSEKDGVLYGTLVDDPLAKEAVNTGPVRDAAPEPKPQPKPGPDAFKGPQGPGKPLDPAKPPPAVAQVQSSEARPKGGKPTTP